MISLLKLISIVILVLIALGFLRTWQLQHTDNQKIFIKGTVPHPQPDGLYAGSVPSRTVSWRGKKFNASNSAGINVFDDGGGKLDERYPFTTSVGIGATDPSISVLKIDYSIPANPFWLRVVLDEIAQVSPGHLLGKLQLRIIPGMPFTLTYFELKK